MSRLVCGAVLACLCAASAPRERLRGAAGAPKADGARVPPSITTPDSVQTRFGALSFKDGMPSSDTVRLTREALDLVRGIDTFLDMVPAASLEALRTGQAELGAVNCSQGLYFDKLMDSEPLFLTGNTDTVYASVFLDLERDGPTVVEVPANMGPGTINDAFFRFVVDTGPVGADHGRGGRYLILPPTYADLDPPEGGDEATFEGEQYFVAKSRSFTNWLVLRGYLVDGKPDYSAQLVETGVRVYPLSYKASPPAMQWISGSRKAFNTVFSNDFRFYEEVWRVLQKEPLGFIDPEMRGRAAAVGLRKGSPFQPDDRLRRTLSEAVQVANGMARSIAFRPKAPEAYLYGEGSGWYTPFVGGSYKWLWEDGRLGRNQDARLSFFYVATVNTPAMVEKMVGRGSQYAAICTDSEGEYFDGNSSYRLTLPKDIPAKDFWSLVVYDPQTRSQLRTSSAFPSKNSQRDTDLVFQPDGSVDIYVAPQAPAGREANWIESVPGKSWFAILRLYGPLDSWFDKTWRPSEIGRL